MTDIPTDIKVEKKLGSIKTNTILIGIIEVSLFYFIAFTIDEMMIREYRIKHPTESYSAIIFIFSVIFFPLINLFFRNFRALIGNIIGIPIFAFIFTAIAALFFGYRG